MKSNNPLKNGDKLLDIACGIGVFSNSLGSIEKEIYGFDLDKSSIQLAHNLQFPRSRFFIAIGNEAQWQS